MGESSLDYSILLLDSAIRLNVEKNNFFEGPYIFRKVTESPVHSNALYHNIMNLQEIITGYRLQKSHI